MRLLRLAQWGPRLSLCKKAEKSSRNDARSITFQRFLNRRRSSSVYRHVTIPMCQYVRKMQEFFVNYLAYVLPLDVKEKNGERASIVVKGAVVEGMTGSGDKKRANQ